MRVFCLLALAPVLSMAAEFTGDLMRTASTSVQLKEGETAEISAGLPAPSQLPANGRVAVEFAGFRKITSRPIHIDSEDCSTNSHVHDSRQVAK